MKLSERFKPWRRSLRSLRQPNHNPIVGGAFKPSFIPPARPVTDDGELDRVLHPSQFYRQPADVLADRSLTISEQRAILSSWASDAVSIDSAPTLRRPIFAEQPASLDAIMDALRQLDLQAAAAKKKSPPWETKSHHLA